jgi:hypothetical protein
MAPCRLRILVFPEPHGTWTARGLEHDLAAEGRTIESAVDTLVKIVRAHIAYDRRHNREPLSAFAAAPQLYWNGFTRATPLPIPLQLDWSENGLPAEIIAAVTSHHPAMRRLRAIARTA